MPARPREFSRLSLPANTQWSSRGDGAWVEDSTGKRYLDAMSGGSMAATLGHGRRDIIEAGAAQAARLSYVHNERLTNPAREQLAAELVEVGPPGITRVRFMTGGAEANEMAIQMARSYHVERGETERWQVISPAQAYHGPTMATLALDRAAGAPGAVRSLPADAPPHPSEHAGVSIRAARRRSRRSTRRSTRPGRRTCRAFFCEPISAAALPALHAARAFLGGAGRAPRRHGFLICFDEVVTGVGRTGRVVRRRALPLAPDIIATAKGLGAGYAAIGAVLCADHVYEAIAKGRAGSRWATRGTGRRSPAPSGSRCSMCCAARAVERVARAGHRAAG